VTIPAKSLGCLSHREFRDNISEALKQRPVCLGRKRRHPLFHLWCGIFAALRPAEAYEMNEDEQAQPSQLHEEQLGML
jgi:hypothetical protein